MAEKAKEVAIEEADRIKSLAVTAARSGAYLYPLRVSWSEFSSSTKFADVVEVGYRIFPHPPRPMEPSHQEACTHHNPWLGCNHLHVPLHLHPPSRSHGLHKRSACSDQRRPTRP